MKAPHQGLQEKYAELKKIHHKALHELADAAQIIKSYEFLEKQYKKENALLQKVLTNANKICEVSSYESFMKKRVALIRAIQEYKSAKTGNLYQRGLGERIRELRSP